MKAQTETMQTETLHNSPAALGKAVAGAAIGAAVILALFVLPAETGYDPTGVGAALGLTSMVPANNEAPALASVARVAVPTASKAAVIRKTPYRTDEKTLTLPPHSGVELKAHMVTGDNLVFRWEAQGGPVKMDMHGEPPKGVTGEATTYWKELGLKEAQGALTAAFDGQHGWYWRNKGDVPVKITLRTAGFYKDIFQPEG